MGEIAIGFLGPSCTDTIASTALDAILSYLCGSSASILENVLVEKEELASAIMYEKDDRPDTLIWLLPSGVATDKLAHVEQRLISLIRQTLDEPLDMSYMRDSLRREKRQLIAMAEGSEDYWSANAVLDYLYGKRDGSTLLSWEACRNTKL